MNSSEKAVVELIDAISLLTYDWKRPEYLDATST